MKQLTGILLAIVTGLSACIGPPGVPGEDGYSPGFYVEDFSIRSEDWQLFYDEEGKPYFEYRFNVPEINAKVFDTYVATCYLVQDVRYNDGTALHTIHEPLPCTYNGEYNNGMLYSEQYTIEYNIGFITFIVRNNTFDDRQQPLDCRFHLTMMWP